MQNYIDVKKKIQRDVNSEFMNFNVFSELIIKSVKT